MNESQQQTPRETAEEKYNRLMGDGSVESLRAMVKQGMEDIKAGRVYTTEQLRERFRAKKANKTNNQ